MIEPLSPTAQTSFAPLPQIEYSGFPCGAGVLQHHPSFEQPAAVAIVSAPPSTAPAVPPAASSPSAPAAPASAAPAWAGASPEPPEPPPLVVESEGPVPPVPAAPSTDRRPAAPLSGASPERSAPHAQSHE